ncbi:MAG: long-chain fatty acid--CoA ligase, partial [Trueperaceae bacterium]
MSSLPKERATSIPALLQRRAGSTSVALRVKRLGLWESVSWQRYARSVRALTAYLLKKGLEPGERVAVFSENRPEWLVADMGIQGAGAITVGVYVTSGPEQLRYYLEHSGAKGLILEGAEQLEKWLLLEREGLGVEWVVAFDPEGRDDILDWQQIMEEGARIDEMEPGVVDERLATLSPEDPALFIYTSGTTGLPKAAVLSHQNLLWAAETVIETFSFNSDDELLSFLPLSHIVERLITVAAPLLAGYTVSFTENPDTVLTNLQEIRPTLFFAVPRIWEKIYSLVEIHMQEVDLLKRSAYRWAMATTRRQQRISVWLAHLLVLKWLRARLGLDRVRLAISGAAPISPHLLAYFRAIGLDMREGYGMTENSGLTSIHQRRLSLGTVGEPFPGVEVKIGHDGEILTRSEGVFLGYFSNRKATEEVLRDGWLHTGDVGEFDAEGQLSITDRKKDIIVTAGGKNIAPQKIENVLKASIYVSDAVVFGDRRKYLVALLVLDEDTLSRWAADHQIPYTTYRDLMENAEVGRLISATVAEIN